MHDRSFCWTTAPLHQALGPGPVRAPWVCARLVPPHRGWTGPVPPSTPGPPRLKQRWCLRGSCCFWRRTRDGCVPLISVFTLAEKRLPNHQRRKAAQTSPLIQAQIFQTLSHREKLNGRQTPGKEEQCWREFQRGARSGSDQYGQRQRPSVPSPSGFRNASGRSQNNWFEMRLRACSVMSSKEITF